MTTRRSLRICCFVCVIATILAHAGNSGYHVTKTYKLGGEGGWDYLTLDTDTRKLYISRSTHMIVLDADSGKVLGDITDTPGVHGIALDKDLGRGFISNGREGTVSVVDLSTLKTRSKIKVGDNPDAILFEPSTKRVFTFNGRSHDSSVIDPSSGKVLATIPLSGKPEFAVSDEQGRVFVNIEDKSELIALDPDKMEVKSRWPLAPCQEPTGLALDRQNRRLFSGCDKLMAVLDADSGKLVATLPICDGVDGVAYDSETHLAFASCHDGKMTIVQEESPQKFRVLDTVATQEGARTLVLDPKNHQIYTVTAMFGQPPAATEQQPHPRSAIQPDSFVVLVVGK